MRAEAEMDEMMTTAHTAERPVTNADFAAGCAEMLTSLVEALNLRSGHRTEVLQAVANRLYDRASAAPTNESRKAMLGHMALAVMARE